MKSIYDILAGFNVEIPEESKKDFEKELYSNYKSVAEFNKKEESIQALNDQLTAAKEGLKKFEGVDVNDLHAQITKLTGDLETKDQEWSTKLKGMEFDHMLDGAISSAKGKNVKAIKALLDIDTLKASNDLSKDLASAVEKLKTENEYLFDAEETPGRYAGGTGTNGGNGGKVTPPAFF